MSTVVKIEHLGKKYLISHEKQARYETLRDSVAHAARGAWQCLRHPLEPNRESIETEEFWALADVNLEIARGDRVGVIGQNGAGKSTLLKILSRITEPTTGRVTIRGRVASLLEVGTGFHPELTGRENVFLNGAVLGMSRQEIRSKFDEIVAFAEVEKFLDTPVKRYSSGMYVRLAFAIAAHLEPEILIVDEVLAVGDAAFQKKCLGKMSEAHRRGNTVLFVSHNMRAVKQLCNRGVVLKAGSVAFSGSAAAAVDAYLNMNETCAAQRDVADAIALLPEDRVFRLDSVRLTQDGLPMETVDNGKPLEIEIEYQVLEETKGLRVYFDLCDAEETILIRSFHDEDNDGIPTVRPASYRSRVTIPGDFLGPTSYLLVVRASIYNERPCLPPSGVRFLLNVEQGGRYNRAYLGDTFRAKLAPVFDWKTQRLP